MIARLVAISRRALLVVLAIAVPSATADAVAAHGPDPALSGGLFGQNGRARADQTDCSQDNDQQLPHDTPPCLSVMAGP